MTIYTVQPGDTIAGLSLRFGIPANRIAADNQLRDPSNLVLGLNLVIASDNIRYVLREGQTLYSISQEYGVPLEELFAANPNVNPFSLRIGETINIPVSRPINRRPAIINGYAYPTINPNSLNCSLPFLTFISPFSYTLTAQGELVPPDDSDLIYRAVRSAVMPLMTVTNIFDGSFSTEALSAILADPELTERLSDSILYELGQRGYYGLNLDMEYIAPEDKERYNAFLFSLAERLHERGYVLVTALAPKTSADQQGILYESHDYAAQGQAADYVILMTYEWGYTFGPPLAVSPLNEVRKVIEYAITEMPSQKILMGIPNYGYDWTLPYTRGTAARSLGLTEAVELAQRFGVEIQFDERAQSPFFYYTDNGVQHVVWFEDPRSIEAKLSLINEYDLAGASWWTINRCYLPGWLVTQNMFDIVKQ